MNQLEKELEKLRKMFPSYLGQDFSFAIADAGLRKTQRFEEAFSFPEVIDKFIIIAVKREYIRDSSKAETNKNDYRFLYYTVRNGFAERTLGNVPNLFQLIHELWTVNVEIFILNDVCRSNKDDHIVAEGSRKMVEMMKKRSSLKHSIGLETGDVVHEVKQYGL